MPKRYKPTRKAISYIRRLISLGTWKVNSKIPPLRNISEQISVSYSTVRNAVRFLENEGTLQNYGSLGFYVTSDKLSKLKEISNNQYYIQMLKTNLKVVEELNKGGVKIGTMVIRYIPSSGNIISTDIISGKKNISSLVTLNEIISKPLKPEDLLKIRATMPSIFGRERKKYDDQQKLTKLAQIVSRHKKELKIHGE
jgi:DNA-binding transcriptional regulator YhcF (GntR family)